MPHNNRKTNTGQEPVTPESFREKVSSIPNNHTIELASYCEISLALAYGRCLDSFEQLQYLRENSDVNGLTQIMDTIGNNLQVMYLLYERSMYNMTDYYTRHIDKLSAKEST